jgi:pyruvate kinase
MRRQRRTKIVATLGPSSSDQTVIARLFEAGADVFRINMSHTSHERMRMLVRMIRAIEEQYVRPIGILVDLQGPKLRVGAFTSEFVVLEQGATFVLDSDPTDGNTERVYLPHPEILASLEPGHSLLLDDGKLRLVAIETSPQRVVTRVEVGGKLSARKGVSLPDTTIAFSALTPKDRADLDAALDAGIDWVALSFGPSAIGNLGHDRRPDGCARRSRRRDAVGKSSRTAETDDARGPPRRQTRGRCDADAGIDDHQSGADAGGSLRCCHRHL